MKNFLIVLLIVLGGCISDEVTNEDKIVEAGDTVYVNYIGKVYDTDLLFDTSYESVAKDPNIPKVEGFQPRSEYGPVVLVVGGKKMPEGFENALIGMRKGEEKEAVVLPEKGYGMRDKNLVEKVARVVIIPRTTDFPLDAFKKGTGVEPVVNETVKLNYWDAKVIDVSNSTVWVLHQPVNGTTVSTDYGPALVTVNSTSVKTELKPSINAVIVTAMGPAVVTAMDESTVSLDYNHYLAGKTLLYKIKVERIVKG